MTRNEAKNSSRIVFTLNDKGGRRSGIDRRQFSYELHIPERRSGRNRRSGKDRRKDIDLGLYTEPSIVTKRSSDLS
ncbi:MAG: hypothetical protein ACXACA_03480 [Candidatus Ranarchaeia archaeon]